MYIEQPQSEVITIGADPEMFAYRIDNEKPVPIIGKLGGTKFQPKPFLNGAVQEDNVMAEFNIAPATSASEFSASIGQMIDGMQDFLKPQGLFLQNVAHEKFTAKQLNHPQAFTIGCEPDFNAWTEEPNPHITAELLGNIRVAAGHVHVGYPNPNQDPNSRIIIARLMDCLLGLPSLLLDPDRTRRQFYGKAGAYRPKPYGLEYRVLSNFWITNAHYRMWVFRQARAAVEVYLGHAHQNYPIGDHSTVRAMIDTYDITRATRVMKEYGIGVP